MEENANKLHFECTDEYPSPVICHGQSCGSASCPLDSRVNNQVSQRFLQCRWRELVGGLWRGLAVCGVSCWVTWEQVEENCPCMEVVAGKSWTAYPLPKTERKRTGVGPEAYQIGVRVPKYHLKQQTPCPATKLAMSLSMLEQENRELWLRPGLWTVQLARGARRLFGSEMSLSQGSRKGQSSPGFHQIWGDILSGEPCCIPYSIIRETVLFNSSRVLNFRISGSTNWSQK